jgi:hypothetical protein
VTGHELAAEDAPPKIETRFWLRQCNGALPGELIGLLDADWCAQQNNVAGSLETGLTWTARGTQDPRSPDRVFTLTPLTDTQAREWIRANRRTTT